MNIEMPWKTFIVEPCPCICFSYFSYCVCMLMRQKAGGQIITTLTTPGISSCGRTKLWRDFHRYPSHFPLGIKHDEVKKTPERIEEKLQPTARQPMLVPDSRTKQQQMRSCLKIFIAVGSKTDQSFLAMQF